MNIREMRASDWIGTGRVWLERRSERERLLLGGLAVLACLSILMFGVWGPLASARAEAVLEIGRYDALLARTRQSPEALTAAAPQGPTPSLADSAASHGLLIRRIEPEGETTRIAFEDADFAALIGWIVDMEASGVAKLSSVQLERRPAPGVVNAQISVVD
ncbi:MAG: type II secretion system protein GspM [Alphaproteobacteria bacterium]|nr:type II secretion system protein GspM [Alphaproteobacteria bacterium]